ncbi:unnamed protein product [Soboliphyme baturini]|uniref:RILP-like protein 1 n=1 Tax=Soboliphyme baturini TaxID=241478 RepID=A0A183IWK0_9BILA|nr:unnamed protein product [Soboliphyme baturini]
MSAADSPSRHVTVVDVYDLASMIGKDFERLMDLCGIDSVAELMPKVISALELLEAFAIRNERENHEILVLRNTVDRLEADKRQKKMGKQKFEEELEQVEEHYKNEINQAWETIQKLQEENRRLSTSLAAHEDSPTEKIFSEDPKVLFDLRESVQRSRKAALLLQRSLEEKDDEIDELHQEIENLQHIRKELLRKYNALQNQGRILVEEKVELISQLQNAEKEKTFLQQKLDEKEQSEKDMEEKDDLKTIDDENVPRFTLAELREVLLEKNQLKARVLELEEELQQLRPPPPSAIPEENESEELVVYGPINKEPEEKLYPWKYSRKDSGIKRL